MKKLLLLTTFLTLGATCFSQSQKNDLKLTVSGLPLYGTSGSFESGLNGIVLKPSIGYYFSDKSSIELNFSYATLNDLNVGNVSSFYRSYAIVPTVRHNFINKQKLRVFGELGFGLGTIRYDAENENFRNSQHELLSAGISIINIGIGGNYYFNDRFGLEVIIPYIKITDIVTGRTNDTYSGIGPTLGFTYKLN